MATEPATLLKASLSWAFILLLTALFSTAGSGHALEKIHLVKLDTNCTYYATFQSHNQKVLQNS